MQISVPQDFGFATTDQYCIFFSPLLSLLELYDFSWNSTTSVQVHHRHPATGYASNNICPLMRHAPALPGISLHSVAASYVLKRSRASSPVSASHTVLPLGIVLCRYTQARKHPKERLGFVCLFPPHFSPLFNTPISPRFTSCCFDTHYGIHWKAHNVFSHVLLATLTSPFFDLHLFGWQGGHVAALPLTMCNLKKVSNEAAQPACRSRSVLCDWKVMMERRIGGLKSWFCSLRPLLICCYMSESSFLISFLRWIATSAKWCFTKESFYASCFINIKKKKESLTSLLRPVSGPFRAIGISNAWQNKQEKPQQIQL